MLPTPPQLQNISIIIDNGVAILKYNRPAAGNAINKGVFEVSGLQICAPGVDAGVLTHEKDLLSATSWALSNDEVRVLVQSGEGKFFTAGMDLVDSVFDDNGQALMDESFDILGKYHELIINTNKILIAAVNGPGVGYGASSIALFDLVYAVPDAYFFTPFVKWGLCAEACSSVTFARSMGRQKAAALLLADERVSAHELERAGLITKIIPSENFLPDVLKVAHRIARLPPRSLAFNKELMMRPLKQELLDANEAEVAGLKMRFRDSEPKDAIRAFVLSQEQKKQRAGKARI